MVPMLAKGMGALGSLLLDPTTTASDAEQSKHMAEAGHVQNAVRMIGGMGQGKQNFPNPADDSTGAMMRSMGKGGY